MKSTDTFESKLKSKLEAYEAPYDPAYWKAYSKKYRKRSFLAFLKLWYVPYLFSGLLFALLWFVKWPAAGSQNEQFEETTATIDTVVVQKIITRVDTLYIRDTVVISPIASEQKNWLSTSSQRARVPASQNAEKIEANPSQVAAVVGQGATTATDGVAQRQPNRQFTGNRERRERVIAAREQALGRTSRETEPDNAPIAETAMDSLPPTAIAEFGTKNSIINSADEPMPEKTESGKKEKRTVKTTWISGPEVAVFMPLSSNNFDTYTGVFLGYGGTFRINRWELQTAAQFGFMQNEIDEITAIPDPIYNSYPNIGIAGVPENIEIISTHVHLPLLLGYHIFHRNRLALSAKMGLLGNYLITETFEYSFDNYDREDVQTIRNTDQGLLFSHAIGGVQAHYQLNDKWDLAVATQYYHPINIMGRSQLNTAGVALQLGVMRRF